MQVLWGSSCYSYGLNVIFLRKRYASLSTNSSFYRVVIPSTGSVLPYDDLIGFLYQVSDRPIDNRIVSIIWVIPKLRQFLIRRGYMGTSFDTGIDDLPIVLQYT